MKLNFLTTVMLIGFLAPFESALGGPKRKCASLRINYSNEANYTIYTTYTSCITGQKVSHDFFPQCPIFPGSRPCDPPDPITDVLEGSDLVMGPIRTYTTTYNTTNTKAKSGNNVFLCRGSIGTYSAKCVPN